MREYGPSLPRVSEVFSASFTTLGAREGLVEERAETGLEFLVCGLEVSLALIGLKVRSAFEPPAFSASPRLAGAGTAVKLPKLGAVKVNGVGREEVGRLRLEAFCFLVFFPGVASTSSATSVT